MNRWIGTMAAMAVLGGAAVSQNPKPGGTGSGPGTEAVGRQIVKPGPWPMKYANAARTGQSNSIGATLGQTEWKWRVPGEVPGLAVDCYGRIYFGTTFYEPTWSGDTYLSALDSGGNLAWRRRVEPFPWGGSQGVDSWPAIDRVNRIVLNSTNGQLLRLNREGDILDTIQGNSGALNDSAPAVLDDGSFAQYEFTSLKRYDARGVLLWSTGLFSQTSVAVAPNGDFAMGGVRTIEPHGAPDNYYVNADGTIRWSNSSTWGNNEQPLFGPDGTLYQGSKAFNPDGSIKWQAANGSVLALSTTGVLYSTFSKTLMAREAASGAMRWSIQLPDTAGSTTEGIAIDVRGVVYLTTSDGYLFSVDAGGNVLLRSKICDSFSTPPVIGPNASIVAVGKDTTLGAPVDFVYKVF